jgi:hypothetical protein
MQDDTTIETRRRSGVSASTVRLLSASVIR